MRGSHGQATTWSRQQCGACARGFALNINNIWVCCALFRASAHTTQFVEPGWKILHGSSGDLVAGGSYLTMVSPGGKDFSMIIETGHAACHHCGYDPNTTASTNPQIISVTLEGELARVSSVTIWHTSPNVSFVSLGEKPVHSSSITLEVEPESIYTITTTTGQTRGSFSSPPAKSAPFPTTWSDNFDSAAVESLAKYWADQCGGYHILVIS